MVTTVINHVHVAVNQNVTLSLGHVCVKLVLLVQPAMILALMDSLVSNVHLHASVLHLGRDRVIILMGHVTVMRHG